MLEDDGTFSVGGASGRIDAAQMDRLARSARGMQYDPDYVAFLRAPLGEFPAGSFLLSSPDRLVLGTRTVGLDGVRGLDSAGLLEWKDPEARERLVGLSAEDLVAQAVREGKSRSRREELHAARTALWRWWRIGRMVLLAAVLVIVLVFFVTVILPMTHGMNPATVLKSVLDGGSAAFRALSSRQSLTSTGTP